MEENMYSKSERQNAIDTLRNYGIKPGSTIYTKVTHVARSGMSRCIDVYVADADGINCISYYVARATENGTDKSGAVRIGGCGMDMGFSLIYHLSSRMFPDGFDCIGANCPANDHRNGSDPAHHHDGGYALVQRWM